MAIKTNKSAIVWGELVISIFRLNALFMTLGNKIARPAGQTSARWFVLAASYLVPQTVSQIARRMGVTRQGIQRTADQLVKEGLVVFRENEAHKRSRLIELTEKGKLAMESIAKEQGRWAAKWSKHIEEANLSQVLESLHRIEKICRSTRPEPTIARFASGEKRRVRR